MMESKSEIPPSLSYVDTTDTLNLCETCVICGDQNPKMNYGVRCCDSCKIFFRRNARIDLNIDQCKFGEECLIRKLTRHECRYCRLKKCLSVGMKKDLLRAPHGAQGGIKTKQKQLSSLITIHPCDLLRNDRSLLTVDQWSLLSNINNSYNNTNPTAYIRYIISTQSNHPPKLRLKMANDNVMAIVGSMYLVIEPFIKTIPEFSTMDINDQTALIERNLRNLGGFNSIFLMHETDILNDVTYSNSLLSIYGSWLHNATIKLSEETDNDGTLIKLLLVILAFSTSCDVVSLEFNQNQLNNATPTNRILTETGDLLKIQNIYTEMMFKYMSYRYGYDQAALRFAHLIKNFLYQGVLTANAVEILQHESMVQTVIDKAEQSLILED